MGVTIGDFRNTIGSLVEQPGEGFASFGLTHGESAADVRNLRFKRLVADEFSAYDVLVRSTFEHAGIFSEEFLALPASVRYGVIHITDGLVGACAFRDASDNEQLVDQLTEHLEDRPQTLWEVNNVAVAPGYRPSLLSAFLLFGCALTAHRNKIDALAGIIRSAAIPALTHFGLVPTYHEPLHILNRPDISDFIVYYDTKSAESVRYMWERAARYFYSEHTLFLIAERAKRDKLASL